MLYGNRIDDFHEAIYAGVVKVEQSPNLAPGLTLKEHLALLLSSISVKTGGLERRCEELMGRLGVRVSLDARVEDLSISHLRIFEIAKALLLCELLEEAERVRRSLQNVFMVICIRIFLNLSFLRRNEDLNF